MRRPNVLVLHTDQQRWDALGANGNPHIKTPNLDRLAARGTNFQAHFVQNPVCMPSRISMMTGQYPSTLGLQHMAVPVPEDTLTVQRIFGRFGYHTALIGKLHFLPHACRDHRELHPDYGFDHLELSDEPGCYEDAYYHWVKRQAPDQVGLISPGLPPATQGWYQKVRFQDAVRHPPERFPKQALEFRAAEELTHAAFVGTQTVEYIRQHAHESFFCFSGFYSPHSPFVAPRRYLDQYDPDTLPVPDFPEAVDAKRRPDSFSDEEIRSCTQGYYAMVTEVDHYVGEILACLEEAGIADNTIIVFTSDHGEWLGEHLHYGKGYPAADCISRVPLIVYDPRNEESHGSTVTNIVESIDILPTLLGSAGIPCPGRLQGRDLLANLGVSRLDEDQIAITEMTGWKAMRVPGYRYIMRASGEELLFDLEKDPGEYENVASSPGYADVLGQLRARLLRRLLQTERPKPLVWAY
ncbi:MAG: sulfatase-like hydrolase/transferase [Lentisphaeria bacterium]|nr:sulfatase-like hydrolase/transferase [Lentisphaeria bacterium]